MNSPLLRRRPLAEKRLVNDVSAGLGGRQANIATDGNPRVGSAVHRINLNNRKFGGGDMANSSGNGREMRGRRPDHTGHGGDLGTEFRARICKQGLRAENSDHLQRCSACDTLHELPRLRLDTIWVCQKKRCRKRNIGRAVQRQMH